MRKNVHLSEIVAMSPRDGVYSREVAWMQCLLRVCLAVSVVFGSSLVQPVASQAARHSKNATRASIRGIQGDLGEATEKTAIQSDLAEELFRRAFDQAISMTQPSFSKACREEAYALASRCLHPTLFTEVRMAVETYLKLFPTGRHHKEVMFNKALLEYAEGRVEDGRAALASVAEAARGKERGRLLAIQLDGLLVSGRYKLAADLLEEIRVEKSGIGKAANKRFLNDRKRFEHGSTLVEEALKDVTAGPRDPESAAAALRRVLDVAWFAPLAPEASLLMLAFEDSAKPDGHGCDVRLFDKTRTNLHFLSPVTRAQRLESFLKAFPEADPEMRGRALIQLFNIQTYELKNPDGAADAWLRLAGTPGFAGRAQVERDLVDFSVAVPGTPLANSLLYRLEQSAALFPFDDGYHPVLATGDLRLWRALSELSANGVATLSSLVLSVQTDEKIRSIPLKLLLLIAGNHKDEAYRLYRENEKKLVPRDRVFVRDLMFPLYNPISDHDRSIAAGAALSTKFPEQAIDALLKALTTMPPSRSNHHALALLAELYQVHRNYIEGQAVWTHLRTLYPNSSWLR
ncbi:MAG: hypothetical protein WA705_01255 [Candidatus Ozemobacteraceae bacterium]